MYRFVFVTILATLFLAFRPSQVAQACSCVAQRDLVTEYSSAEAVFEGTVVAVNRKFAWTLGSTGDEAIYEVTRVWKGITNKYVVVDGGDQRGCGTRFAIDGSKKILVSRANDSSPISQNVCSYSPSASVLVAAYGQGSTDLRNNWWLLYVPSTWPLLVAAIGLGTLLLLGTWYWHHLRLPKIKKS